MFFGSVVQTQENNVSARSGKFFYGFYYVAHYVFFCVVNNNMLYSLLYNELSLEGS